METFLIRNTFTLFFSQGLLAARARGFLEWDGHILKNRQKFAALQVTCLQTIDPRRIPNPFFFRAALKQYRAGRPWKSVFLAGQNGPSSAHSPGPPERDL